MYPIINGAQGSESVNIPDKFDVVIYHENCNDGFTAAWVARRHSPDAEFIGAHHGDPPPDVTDKVVLIVDFCYPRDLLLQMESQAESILVLDHHKTAMEDLDGIDFAVFDMNRSGAGLAWDFLMPGLPRPAMVTFVEDWDLWRFQHEGTRPYHAAMGLHDMTFDEWDKISQTQPAVMFDIGTKILTFIQKTARKIVDRACYIRLAGRRTVSFNAPVELVSETADILLKTNPRLPVLGWMWDGRREQYKCSLRSIEGGPDVAELAKKFGGGGHKHAAGFLSDIHPEEIDMTSVLRVR